MGFAGRLGIFPDRRGTWSVPSPFRIYLENRNQVLLEQAGPSLSAWGRSVKMVLPRTRVQRGLPKRRLPFPGISFNLGCWNDSLRRMVYCRGCKNLADGSQLHTSRLQDHGQLGFTQCQKSLSPSRFRRVQIRAISLSHTP